MHNRFRTGWGLIGLILLGLLGAHAQTLPAKGTAQTLDVATWNIEWFGHSSNGPSNDQQQFDFVVEILRQSDVDLWALQEIADRSDFTALLNALGSDYDGVIASISGQQRIAFIYKTGVFRDITTEHILSLQQSDRHAFAQRPPLKFSANANIGSEEVDLHFITMHMKCCGSSSDFDRRTDASEILKNYLDTELPDEPAIILGDFNDLLHRSIYSGSNVSPFRNIIQDDQAYFFVTTDMAQGGVNTYCNNSSCSSGSTIDHILITNELFAQYVPGSADHYDEVLDEISGYVNNTSDHLPVIAQFAFPFHVNTTLPDLPEEPVLLAPAYPNPFDQITRLTYALPTAQSVNLTVFNVLGQPVATLAEGFQQAGPHTATFARNDLPAGVYFARLTTATTHHTQRLLVMR